MSNKIIYLFEIYLKSGDKIFLNSSSQDINIENIYLKYSNLNIKEGEFNDSAQNYVNIQGIFEKGGINNDTDLNEAEFIIYIYDSISKTAKLYLDYFYSNHISSDDKHFIVSLVPISKRLNQKLLKVFSKTCRANFGDRNCGVQIENYKKSYKIKSIVSNFITVENCDKESGYFDGGNLYFENSCKKFLVEKHNNNIIKLKITVPQEFMDQKYINLYPICDKEFISCCKLFNNAVNFRGEPFAPTFKNLLK